MGKEDPLIGFEHTVSEKLMEWEVCLYFGLSFLRGSSSCFMDILHEARTCVADLLFGDFHVLLDWSTSLDCFIIIFTNRLSNPLTFPHCTPDYCIKTARIAQAMGLE